MTTSASINIPLERNPQPWESTSPIFIPKESLPPPKWNMEYISTLTTLSLPPIPHGFPPILFALNTLKKSPIFPITQTHRNKSETEILRIFPELMNNYERNIFYGSQRRMLFTLTYLSFGVLITPNGLIRKRAGRMIYGIWGIWGMGLIGYTYWVAKGFTYMKTMAHNKFTFWGDGEVDIYASSLAQAKRKGVYIRPK